jgi:hypothetical protein
MRDLAKRMPAIVKRKRLLLQVPTSLALPAASLATPFKLRRWTKRKLLGARETRRSFSAVVKRPHVARTAKGEEIIKRMVA